MPADLTIEIQNARFRGFHGVLEQEKRVGGEFVADLRVSVPLAEGNSIAAAIPDSVGDTISYADLYAIVEKRMRQSFDLIEHLAAVIIDDIYARWQQISDIELRITKVAPPIPGFDGSAAVTLRRHR